MGGGDSAAKPKSGGCLGCCFGGGGGDDVPSPPPYVEGQHRRNSTGGQASTSGSASSGGGGGEAPKKLEWWKREVSSGVATDFYTLGRLLGKGAFSQVHEGTHKEKGGRWALKCVKLKPHSKTGERDKQLTGVLREVEFQKKIRHPGIVALEEFFVEPLQVVLVMEMMRGQTLLDSILDRGGYTESDARVVFRAVLEAIKYLHACGVAHRDIKLENLMLKQQEDLGSVKIADMGFATMVSSEDGAIRTMAGTPAYLAPEMIAVIQKKAGAEKKFTVAVDMWSAGVSLFLLLGGYPPFDAPTTREVFARVDEGSVTFDGPVWTRVSDAAKSLIRALMTKDPRARLTASQALKHEWFTLRLLDEGGGPGGQGSGEGSGQGSGGGKQGSSGERQELGESYSNLKIYLQRARNETQRPAPLTVPDARGGGGDGAEGGGDPEDAASPKRPFLEMQERHNNSVGHGLNESLKKIFNRNKNYVKPAPAPPAGPAGPMRPQKKGGGAASSSGAGGSFRSQHGGGSLEDVGGGGAHPTIPEGSSVAYASAAAAAAAAAGGGAGGQGSGGGMAMALPPGLVNQAAAADGNSGSSAAPSPQVVTPSGVVVADLGGPAGVTRAQQQQMEMAAAVQQQQMLMQNMAAQQQMQQQQMMFFHQQMAMQQQAQQQQQQGIRAATPPGAPGALAPLPMPLVAPPPYAIKPPGS